MLTKLKMSPNQIPYGISGHVRTQVKRLAAPFTASLVNVKIYELVSEEIRRQTELPVRWPCWDVTQLHNF